MEENEFKKQMEIKRKKVFEEKDKRDKMLVETLNKKLSDEQK